MAMETQLNRVARTKKTQKSPETSGELMNWVANTDQQTPSTNSPSPDSVWRQDGNSGLPPRIQEFHIPPQSGKALFD